MAIDPKKLSAFIKRDPSRSFPPKKTKGSDNPGKPVDDESQQDEEEDEDEYDDDEDEDEDEEAEDSASDDVSDGVDVESIAEDIEAGHGDKRLLKLTKKMLGKDGSPKKNPPQWAMDEATWEKAKEAVDPEGEGQKYDQPWAVVAHVYKQMGGEIG